MTEAYLDISEDQIRLERQAGGDVVDKTYELFEIRSEAQVQQLSFIQVCSTPLPKQKLAQFKPIRELYLYYGTPKNSRNFE